MLDVMKPEIELNVEESVNWNGREFTSPILEPGVVGRISTLLGGHVCKLKKCGAIEISQNKPNRLLP